jgi:hypothetical protein
MARARHLVAFDPATGAGLRRIRERNEDGLLRTYELLPGDTLGARVPVRGADDAESIAKANRLLEWWASMASLGEFYAPNSAQVPTAGDTRDWAAEPLSAAALCAYDTTLRLGQEEMLRYRARVLVEVQSRTRRAVTRISCSLVPP